MIGLSVHLCIRDMATGKVDPQDVEKIIGSTAISNNKDRIDVFIHQNKMSCWGRCQGEAEKLMRQFLVEGKIKEPRLSWDNPRHPVNKNHWVEDESEIVWNYL